MALSVNFFLNLNFKESYHFIDHYHSSMDVSKECLNCEMTVAKNVILQSIGPDADMNVENIIPILFENKSTFPNLYKLFNVALTLPISSATCERSFSAMKKIKTWLRNSMTQDKFTNVSILYIEKDISKNINVEEILNLFANENRYLLLK
ncbi:52 kDa repressor of the inhibitor of the protein kinase-like [Daktulosphaira vitifoliae]|uniref:52 kDa repressor of the inhibitor of the protein kinase-like n=1 Tax=Daktulosphaira vitifoliae TaxID=58002 RepID=UPI0021A998B2|nr:52 kDa repressor of the inhibitor of the protein kinase-like [Daktulosphaira vitifoliae]